MKNRETEVLVVGAGPTGLTVATLLRRVGIDCILIEKNAGPSTTSKAIGLQYRVSELLACLGLLDRFVARAATQSTVTLRDGQHVIARLSLAPLPSFSGAGATVPQPIILPQSETEALLGQALRERGGDVEWSHALADFTQDSSGVIATLESGERIAAKYLVSCEGAHSVARKKAGIAFEGKTYPHDFIMADVRLDASLPHGEAHSWLHSDGVISAITMPGPGRWRLFIEAGPEATDEVTLELVRRIYAQRTADRTNVPQDPTWLTHFKIHSRCVACFRAGRVLLAGDAAHLHSPSGGQGITTGMQDAFNLAWKLEHVLRRGAPDSLLDTYDAERRPAARSVLAATDRNTRVLFARTRLGKWLRDRVLLPILMSGPSQRRLVARLSQLTAHYRHSPLSVHVGSRRGVRAGDRAPDVRVGALSLFDQLQAGRWVAWVTGDRPQVIPMLRGYGIDARKISATPELERLYGLRGEGVVLIRPDGYVGLVCRPIREDVVADYLAKLGLAPASEALAAPLALAPSR
jgi:4,5-epoxidase